MKGLMFGCILTLSVSGWADQNRPQIESLSLTQERGLTAVEMQKIIADDEGDGCGDSPNVMHSGDSPNVMHAGDSPNVMHAGDSPNVMHAGDSPNVFHSGEAFGGETTAAIPMPRISLEQLVLAQEQGLSAEDLQRIIAEDAGDGCGDTPNLMHSGDTPNLMHSGDTPNLMHSGDTPDLMHSGSTPNLFHGGSINNMRGEGEIPTPQVNF